MARNRLSEPEKIVRVQISNNLKYLTRNMTQRHLSELTGIPPSTLSGYFAQRSTPNAGALQKMADALHVKKSDIDPRYKEVQGEAQLATLPSNMSYLYDSDKLVVRIPIIGTIACGDPITAEQNVDGYTHELFNERPSGTLFALRCKGDSMEPTIPNGAVVIIHQQPDVEDDEVAAVLVDDDNEATLKRVKHSDGQIMLLPENKKYDPILLNEKNPGRILGKVIRVSFDM